MNRRHILLIAAPLLVAVPLIAQTPPAAPPGVRDAARVTAGSYTTDPSHSLISFELNHFGFNAYYGIFGDVAGTLSIDPKSPAAAKVDVTIPVASVTTASKGLSEHLLRAGKDGGKPDFFGPAPAPARFVSTSVMIDRKAPMNAKITGDLTLNGVSKPVTLDARFIGAGQNPFSKKDTVGFEATTTIKRSDWGIGYAVPLVSDAVMLKISVAFEKAAMAQ